MTALTLLNSMLGADFEKSLDRHVELGLRFVDLRDAIYGKSLMELTDAEVARAVEAIRARGLAVYCLSSGLFCDDVERGEDHFRHRHLAGAARLAELAREFRPRFVRLLSARIVRRAEVSNSASYLRSEHPWLVPLYGEAVDLLAETGASVTVENEIGKTIFANPAEIREFFAALGRRGLVGLTWDVQNLWQVGVFPTLEIYRELSELVVYVHVKGGRSAPGTRRLAWRSSLAEADWPVREIVLTIIRDGVSPVICLNPPHGEADPSRGEGYTVEGDLEFMRSLVEAAGEETR